jgi:hypothetical protein
MGTSPVTLLAAPGAGLYYDFDKIIAEYTHVSTPYTFVSAKVLVMQTAQVAYINQNLITNSANRVCIIEPTKYENYDAAINYHDTKPLNLGMQFTTDSGDDPINGNGTMEVKMWYTIRSFG